MVQGRAARRGDHLLQLMHGVGEGAGGGGVDERQRFARLQAAAHHVRRGMLEDGDGGAREHGCCDVQGCNCNSFTL
jgi:hypothetical protein